MSRKKNGFLYEVYPTPAKGKDGGNIVYARPAKGRKLGIEDVDKYCASHHCLRSGELKLVMEEFLKAAGALMAQGYRIDTPIGSFAPKLALTRRYRQVARQRLYTRGEPQHDGADQGYDASGACPE